MNNPASELKSALEKLGAREFEHAALSLDPARGLAALAVAQRRGVDHPISYAIKIFDNADWQPSGEVRRQNVNQHVDRKCAHCDGHGFVLVADGLEMVLYGETWAPCVQCNADTNTERWVGDERRVTAPR